jgi:hypothetical protein
MINSKRGVSNLLTEDIIDIVLDIVVLGILFLFLATRAGDAAAYQEVYAKQIALLLDSAKPGMIIHFNMEKGIDLAKKELGKNVNLNDIIKIQGNIVTVQFKKEGGYSYSFFNNVDANSYIDTTNNKEFVFLIGEGTSLQGTSTLSELMNYAKGNAVVNRNCNCGNYCNDYANYISTASANNGIEPILLLSLMMQESACDQTAVSGTSIGLMQINLGNCGRYNLDSNQQKCKTELISNPELNVEVGAEILKEKYDTYKTGRLFNGCTNKNIIYYNWESALRGYNGWGCGVDSQGNKLTAQDNFVEEVVSRYNELENK